MRDLHVGRGVNWPAAIASQAIGVLGMRGAGKSNFGRVMAEELFASKIPFVVFDPIGNWYGIRAGGDARPGGGVPIPIFGGQHHDLPLDRTSGTKIADLVIDRGLSCVLDLSHEDFSESDKQRFLAEFGDRLFRRKTRESGWLMLLMEEADDYAPQPRSGGGVKGEAAKTLGMFQRLVRRGRFKGLGDVMITQRSAAINKDLLYMVGTLVVFRTTGPRDQEAVDGWLKYNEPKLRQKVMESLATLEDGEAWVISPEALSTIERVRFRHMNTYDTGATPEHGGQAKQATLADIDVPALSKELQAAVEKAKAADPRELQKKVAEQAARIRTLEARHHPSSEKDNRPPKPPREVPVLKDAQIKRLETAIDHYEKVIVRNMEHTLRLGATEREARDRAVKEIAETFRVLYALRDSPAMLGSGGRPGLMPTANQVVGAGRPAVPSRPAPVVHRAPVAERRTEPAGNGDGRLPVGEKKLLVAIAQYTDAGGASREQLSILTGYKRSSRDAYISRLRASGYVDQQGESLVATDAGITALGGDYEPLPTGDELREHWLGRLPEGERRIFTVVAEAYPQPVARADLDGVVGYKRSSRDAYISRLSARKLVRQDGKGAIRAADELFG